MTSEFASHSAPLRKAMQVASFDYYAHTIGRFAYSLTV